jgi:hypothetical protein
VVRQAGDHGNRRATVDLDRHSARCDLALKQNTWVDIAVRVFTIGGIATPSFLIGIVSNLLVFERGNK